MIIKLKYLIYVVVTCLVMTGSLSAALPWLHTEGGHIVDEQGKRVLLRGVNLGGWLVEEMWMVPFKTQPPHGAPFQQIKDHDSLWRCLTQRFGQNEMESMRHAFRENWLQESDFKRIRAAGFNCVRLPFLYDLETEALGLFYWLDTAVEAASRHGLYVILDMHGTPGRQSNEPHTGKEQNNQLFQDRALVQRTMDVWAKIAEHYKNCPTVAGYDLMNEPMGAPNHATLYLVQDHIYRVIRQRDPRHLIFIEDGFKGIEHMPHPHIADWQNVVLSIHFYPRHANAMEEFLQKILRFTAALRMKRMPLYLGEFNVEPHGNAQGMKRFVNVLQADGISWSMWTYKTTGHKAKRSLWGLYCAPKKLEKVNPFKDSKKEIYKKIKQYRTEHCEANQELIRLFQETK